MYVEEEQEASLKEIRSLKKIEAVSIVTKADMWVQIVQRGPWSRVNMREELHKTWKTIRVYAAVLVETTKQLQIPQSRKRTSK